MDRDKFLRRQKQIAEVTVLIGLILITTGAKLEGKIIIWDWDYFVNIGIIIIIVGIIKLIKIVNLERKSN